MVEIEVIAMKNKNGCKKPKSLFISFFKLVERLEISFITLFTFLIGIMIMFQIVRRALGAQSWAWLDELSRYMLIITTLMGCSIAVNTNGHMLMDAIYTKLKPKAAYVVKSIAHLVCIILFSGLTCYSFRWMTNLYKLGKTWESVPLKIWWLWIPIIYALFTMTVRYIIQLLHCLRAVIKNKEIFTDGNTKEM